MLKKEDIAKLKDKLIERGFDLDNISRFIGYVDSINKITKKRDGSQTDHTFGMNIEEFMKLFINYDNIGIVLDGINATLAGKNKVFITWVGYKNKVISVYPESQFDVQLVREGDTFNAAKESGAVVYSHTLSDPFASNKGIIGAYCVIKNMRGEFLETLGKDDFNKMKESAMLKSTWDKWESEFWLKSVIKRACKRHFNDEVAELEKVDNQDYELEDTSEDVKDAIVEAQIKKDDRAT